MAAYTADALIVHFLTYVRQARGTYIERYMALEWGYMPGTTRNALWRMTHQRTLERVGYGTYRLTTQDRRGPAELNTQPTR